MERNFKTTIEYGDSELQGYLSRLSEQFSEAGINAILGELGRRMERIVVLRYPEQSNNKQSDLWTDRQRRYFFAALRDGRIQVPYRRTGKLARSLELTSTVRDGSLSLVVAVDDQQVPYARHVIGNRQSRYFNERSFWRPLPEMIEQQKDEILEAARVSFETILKELPL